MWKKIKEWLRWPWFSASKTLDTVEKSWDNLSDDVKEVIQDIQDWVEDADRRFVVEMEVPEDVKIRSLKTTIEDAIVARLADTHPTVTEIQVKTYYKRG